jgi:iron complex outermembrane recepter protein
MGIPERAALCFALAMVPALALSQGDAGYDEFFFTQDDAEASPAAEGEPEAAAPGDSSGVEVYDDVITLPNEQPATGVQPPPRRSRLIEEIVVTAQKREENLKDVPLSVAAFSADALDARQVLTLQDLPRLTPGLTVTPQAGFTSLFLRGVGSDAYALGDPLVVYYVDGVYIPFAQALFADLGVIEQMEVLKGPQGTLFGRNALGGAVKTTTRDPDLAEVGGQVQAGFGNRRAFKGSTYASIPLVQDTLAIGVAAMYKDSKPYLETLHTAEFVPLPDPHEEAYQIRAKYAATDNLSLRFTYSYNTDVNAHGYNVNTEPGPIALATGYTGQDPRRARIDHDLTSKSRNRIWLGDATLNLSVLDIKLLGSYQDFWNTNTVDFDGTDRPIVNFVNTPGISKAKTAELQLLSNEGTPYSDWIETVFGIYFFDQHAGFRGGANVAGFFCPDGSIGIVNCGGPVTIPAVGDVLNTVLNPLGVNIIGSPVNLGFIALLDTQSVAFYNQTKLMFADWVHLTFGFRYQDEKREVNNSSGLLRLSGDVYDTSQDVPYQQWGPDDFNDTTKALDPKVVLSLMPDWSWLGDGPLIYASYQTATTSSTFNTIRIIPGFPPDFVKSVKLTAYEIGYKTRLFDGLLDLNTAAFYYDIKDPQVQFISLLAGGAVTFENAEGQRIRGAEIDFTARILPDLLNDTLVMTGNATYLDAIYTSYKDGSGFNDQYVFSRGNDYSGNRVTRTPEYSYTVGILATFPTSHGSFELGGNYFFQDDVYLLAQQTDNAKLDAYGTLGAHVSYLHEPWALRVTAFGDNILNEDYNYSLFILDFGKNEHPAPLRTYGLKLHWSF